MAVSSHNGHGAMNDLRDRSIPELIKQLASETSMLGRREIELAKAEMIEKGKSAGVGACFLTGAGVAALLSLGCFSAFVILAFAQVMPAWGAALLLCLVYAGVAGVLAMTGKERIADAAPPAPEEAIESVQEDVRWAKAQLK
jgi:hypothetical protein